MKGEVRAPMTVWLLSMFTCGLYGLYFTYKASEELKNYLGKEDVNPVMITAISYFTCMFWGPFQIGKLIMEAQQRAGVPNPRGQGRRRLGAQHVPLRLRQQDAPGGAEQGLGSGRRRPGDVLIDVCS